MQVSQMKLNGNVARVRIEVKSYTSVFPIDSLQQYS